jgi:hypothetical protein
VGWLLEAGVKLIETKVAPMDKNLVQITGAIEPSGIPFVVAEGGKKEGSGRPDRSRGVYRDSRSRGVGQEEEIKTSAQMRDINVQDKNIITK